MAHIDTLKYYEDLVSRGISQAEASAQAHVLDSVFVNVATKDEIKEVKAEVKEIKSDLRKMFYTMIGGMFVLFVKSFFVAG